MRETTITMSKKEVLRAGLLKAALAGRITNQQGAAALGLTARQFQRLKGRFRAEDAPGNILGLTFRPTEDLHGYTEVFRQTFTEYGLPVSVYGDGSNILVRNDD